MYQFSTMDSQYHVLTFYIWEALEQHTGIEPASPVWKAGILTVVLMLHMVTLPGIEPGITSVKGMCLDQFDYSAI